MRKILMIAVFCILFSSLSGEEGMRMVFRESREWKKLRFTQDTIPGSALDFSFLLDAPAGKYGPVTVSGENFVFTDAPERKIRFYGVNVCFWPNQVWSHDAIDKLTARIAAAGYNAVRLHANDSVTKIPGKPSYLIAPAALDSFDYLLASCKKRGIYFTTDLLCRRRFAVDEIPGFNRPVGGTGGDEFKSLLPLSGEAMESWKKFSKTLLLHKNPYTGMSWKDDPAMLPFCLVNENTIPALLRAINRVPDIKALLMKQFGQWLAEQKLTPENPAAGERLLHEFMLELWQKTYREMRGYLRSLGVRQPFTEQNNGDAPYLSIARNEYDYVDNHFYVDMPRYMKRHGNVPAWIDEASAISGMNADEAMQFPTRIFGKPFTITEFNYTYPSCYRAEMGSVLPAYAALQGWNGMFLYQYTHGDEKSFLSGGDLRLWESSKDPLSMLAARMGAMLFLRGDVRESEISFPVLVDKNCFKNNTFMKYPRVFRYLGVFGKVGTIVTDSKSVKLPPGANFLLTLNPDEKRKPENGSLHFVDFRNEDKQLHEIQLKSKAGKIGHDYWKRFAVSSTGELLMDARRKEFKVITPRSEVIFLNGYGTGTAGIMSVENSGTPATFFVSALDGAELKKSKRILLLHLTNTVASGTELEYKTDRTVIHDLGDMPPLGRHIAGKVKLKLSKPNEKWSLYALRLNGERSKARSVKSNAGGELFLSLGENTKEEPHLAYELIRP
ncbi:MAG: hypothetical protein IJZ19_02080 [Lentisphaeria bacterium]|nr:hypothetical protein [Lentisphaeria bacterium]